MLVAFALIMVCAALRNDLLEIIDSILKAVGKRFDGILLRGVVLCRPRISGIGFLPLVSLFK
jgi:hypothetical protein